MYNFLLKASEGNNKTFIISITADTYADMETKFNAMKGNASLSIEKIMNVQEIVQIPEEDIPQEDAPQEDAPQEEEPQEEIPL